MRVSLISFTRGLEDTCDFASKTCVSESMYGEWGVDPEYKSMKSAMKSGHLSVLEHANFTFYIAGISRACSHQLVRHRMASYSQQSQRYVNMSDFDYVTPHSISDADSNGTGALVCYIRAMENLQRAYHELVEAHHIPKEDARYLLPNACCTNITVTMNARELLHFIELRTCERAQWEIREVAEKMLQLAEKACPTIFREAGPQCIRLGYCPEARGCGKYPKLDDLHSAYWKSLLGDKTPKTTEDEE